VAGGLPAHAHVDRATSHAAVDRRDYQPHPRFPPRSEDTGGAPFRPRALGRTVRRCNIRKPANRIGPVRSRVRPGDLWESLPLTSRSRHHLAPVEELDTSRSPSRGCASTSAGGLGLACWTRRGPHGTGRQRLRGRRFLFQAGPLEESRRHGRIKSSAPRSTAGPGMPLSWGSQAHNGPGVFTTTSVVRPDVAPRVTTRRALCRRSGAVSSYGEEWEIPLADLEGIQTSRLEGGLGPDAYPSIYHQGPGTDHATAPWCGNWTDGSCLRAVPACVNRRQPDDLTAKPDRGPWRRAADAGAVRGTIRTIDVLEAGLTAGPGMRAGGPSRGQAERACRTVA